MNTINIKIIELLKKQGYNISKEPYNMIDTAMKWYRSEPLSFRQMKTIDNKEFTIEEMPFAKRICADEANLLEIVEIKAEKDTDFIVNALDFNNFSIMLRKQTELVPALGTVACYCYQENSKLNLSSNEVSGGRTRLAYVDASGIIPLTVINDEIVECAFYGESLKKGRLIGTLVKFTINEKGNYQFETWYFDINDKQFKEIPQSEFGTLALIELGKVKPFAIARNSEVNNRTDMQGFGLSKLYNIQPVLKALDVAFSLLNSDLSLSRKILLINEKLAGFDEDGKPNVDPKQTLFVMLGEKLSTDNTLIHEYDPKIRVESISQAIEFLLSLLGIFFGFGAKQYNFEQGTIMTASQYIGEKQDKMQELNKQRAIVIKYIQDIVKFILWSSNEYNAKNYDIEQKVIIDFDDSYITDKASYLLEVRNDALSFPEIPQILILYLMEKYNLDEKTAKEWASQKQSFDENTEEEGA